MLGRIREEKLKEIEELRKAGIDPYPHKFDKKMRLKEIRNKYGGLGKEEVLEDEKVKTAGRVMVIRYHGKSSFLVIKDETDRLQIYMNKNKLKEKYDFFKEYLKIGDIIGLEGFPFKSRTGELTIFVEDFVILSKAMRTLPEKWHGLRDKEIIYRQRYVDMIANDETLRKFKMRYEMVRSMRRFMENRGFVEVETPVLHHVTGGASARPFVTHLNVLDIDMYLRIAPELYLKRMVVGGFEKIYEIGKNFRNEGISYKHNPEFTSLEAYQAYADYTDMMKLTEDMIVHVVKEMFGKTKLIYQGVEIDFTPPWRKIDMREFVKEKTGLDIVEDSDEKMIEYLREKENLPEIRNRSHIIEKVWDTVEDEIVQPTFVLDHPVDISPLAKRHREDPRLTERFELIIFGREIANAFSELNDPLDQLERFMKQVEMRRAGDEEAQMMDLDFIRALEYGLPPTAGLGIGIDRLAMFLTDSPSIRDVIPFPLVRPEEGLEEEYEELMEYVRKKEK